MKRIAKKINDNDDSIVINLINPNPPEPKKKNRKQEKIFNEQGQRITKKGEIHKAVGRDMSKAQEGLKKWREQQKKLKEEEKGKVIVNDDDESDSDVEYEIDDIEVKKPEPKVIEKEIFKEVEKEVIKEVAVEIIKPDLNVVKENEELKIRNKKLQDSFNYNTHLSRISNMSRQTNLKF